MDGPRSSAPLLARALWSPLAIIVFCIALMWATEIVDSTILGDRLQRNGIEPRRIGGLDGILWTPWLHSGYGHLLSNTVPFVALGWLVSLRGLRYWATVTIAAVVIGGGFTWLLAGGTNHIGASGVVFGYLGALLAGAFYDRRPAAVAPALVALFLYSSLLAGLVPQADISWEGHLFGLIAGALVARRLADPPPDRVGADIHGDDPVYDWEADEPWLDYD